MSDELIDTIAENAAGPKKVAGDSITIEQHPLPDQIEFDRYQAAKTAQKNRRRGFTMSKVVPPGTI